MSVMGYATYGYPYYPRMNYTQPLLESRMSSQSHLSEPDLGLPKQNRTDTERNLVSHQWPWRILAFASDIGNVGYLVKIPQIAKLGWIASLPYYTFAILSQPDWKTAKEELVYQSTANGIFPFLEAKLGVTAGDIFYKKIFSSIGEKFPKTLGRISNPVFKSISGLIALFVLTPMIGDRLSDLVNDAYQKWSMGQHA